ncbi:MAG: TylF/MycF/NovP-related O-methyltransferase [Pannonibacter sp.]
MASSNQVSDQSGFDGKDPLTALLRTAVGSTAGKKAETYNAADLGTYRGRALQAMLTEAAEIGIKIKWLATDTFSGLPPLGRKDVDLAPANANYLSRQMFDDTTVREVRAFLEPTGHLQNVDLREGVLEDVLASLEDQKYLLVNVSVKLYQPHITALDYFYNRMLPGGVIVLDDLFNRRFPMAEAAIGHFMSDKPEQILHLTGADFSGPVKRGFIIRRGT